MDNRKVNVLCLWTLMNKYKIERTRKRKTSIMLSAGFEVERKDAEFW